MVHASVVLSRSTVLVVLVSTVLLQGLLIHEQVFFVFPGRRRLGGVGGAGVFFSSSGK